MALIDDIVVSYYNGLSFLFSPILSLKPIIAVFIIGAIVTFLVALGYKYLMDSTKMNEIKTQQKEKQQKLNELQKTNPQEASKVMNELLALNSSMFRLNMKPLLVTSLIALALLPWMGFVFKQPIAQIPFSLPFPFNGDKLGWLAWYIIISVPLNQLFRKFLGL